MCRLVSLQKEALDKILAKEADKRLSYLLPEEISSNHGRKLDNESEKWISAILLKLYCPQEWFAVISRIQL